MTEWVILEKAVPYEELEDSIMRAVADYGWRTKVVPRYIAEWKLGSVEEVRTHVRDELKIRRGFLGAIRRHVIDVDIVIDRSSMGEDGLVDKFLLSSGVNAPHVLYSSSKKEVVDFLERVGDYLKPDSPLDKALHAGRLHL